jgi:hypothetical protein
MKINNIFRTVQGGLLVAIGFLLTSVCRVQASYESTVLNDHPLAYYALDLTIDNSGTVTDLSGNGNNSSYYSLAATAGPTAYIPNAAFFAAGGVQSFVDLSSGTNAGILNFGGLITMEAWVQSTNTTQGPADILGKGYDSSLNDNELVLRANNSSGDYDYYGGTFNTTNNGASASGSQQTTNWTYLVSTYDGTNWNLYVNAQLVGQGADTAGAINFSDPWAIGAGSADGFSRFFQGTICQVAMYTNALTPAQVLNHYYEGELNAPPATSAPIIVTQPQSQSVFLGGTVTFSVGAVSELPTTNQWYANSVAIAGQTGSTLTIVNVGSATASTNYSVIVGSANGKTSSTAANVTLLATGNQLKWNSAGGNGVWDSGISANWLNLTTSAQTVFNTNDQVLFDDTVGVSNNVTVNGSVLPSLMTVNSSTNNFSFNSGTGSPVITGVGTLVKEGSSVLSIYTPQSFSGVVKILGGTIYAGNNCFDQVSSIMITNNSTWDIGGAAVPGSKPVTVSGTGVGGKGALFDSYGGSSESLNITLAGDTTFGGSARWDLGSGSQITGAHNLTIDWSPDTGNPYGEWTSLTIGANVAGITLTNKTHLGSHNNTTAFQNPGTVFTIGTNAILYVWDGWNGSLHVLNGGQLDIEYPAEVAPFNGNTITFENNAQFLNYNFSGDEPVNSAIILNGVARLLNGDHNTLFTNLISGVGGFVCDAYNHAMIFSAANTYSGPTIIGDGPQVALTNNGSISHSSLIFFGGNNSASVHIDVSGRPDKTLTLASGQTLGGIGTINGNLIVAPGATLSPSGTNTMIGITTGANSTGTLSASNNITLNGNTLMKLDGSGVSDAVASSTAIAYGGTLTLVNISGAPLAVGNSFQLFSAPSMTGSFSSISPATPGAGLAWDTSQLNTLGTLNVIAGASQPVVSSVRILSGNLIFSGSGGTASANYAVLTTTNVTTPLTSWTSLETNSFDATGAFSVTNAISSGTPQRYYRLKLVP